MSAFLVSTETMQRVIAAISKLESWEGVPTWRSSDLDQIGNDLFALNAAAVNDRYPHYPQQSPPLFSYRPLGNVRDEDMFMAVQCLIYQCSEGSIPDRPLYQALTRLGNSLAREIAFDRARAVKAPWNFPEREAIRSNL